MEFIHIKSLAGSDWSIRKDQISMIVNRHNFTVDDIKKMPELDGRDSCAIIHVIGDHIEYYCGDSYETIMRKMGINLEE